jgi:hypothetical protein
MDEMQFIQKYLREGNISKNRNTDNDAIVSTLLKKYKAESVKKNDQEQAKQIWCYEQILNIQKNYLSAFQKMKDVFFFEAWGLLEQVEIGLHFLEPHFKRDYKNDYFLIDFIEKHTKQFQSIFPYKLFLSPAYLYLEKVCSICKKVVSIWNPCGHKKGEIYDGEMCVHEITKAEILELSVVPNPVQKYSVLFIKKSETKEQIDHYNYEIIQYAINGLKTPFDEWEVRWMRVRHPHTLFSHVNRNDYCPCGSGKKYKNCCLPNPRGVLRPHVEFLFSVPPPEGLSAFIYPEYKKVNNPN